MPNEEFKKLKHCYKQNTNLLNDIVKYQIIRVAININNI